MGLTTDINYISLWNRYKFNSCLSVCASPVDNGVRAYALLMNHAVRAGRKLLIDDAHTLKPD